MKLKDKEVIEYTTNEDGDIIRMELKPRKGNSHLSDNPKPPDELIEKGLIDKYGRLMWKRVGDKITKKELGNPSQVEAARDFYSNLTELDKLKLIIKGIQRKNDPDFVAFAKKVDLL